MKTTLAALIAGLGLALGTSTTPAVAACEFQKLTAGDAAERDFLGSSVAISGDYLVAGAPRNDWFVGQPGSAYVFKREGDGWVEQAKLTASDPQPFDWFGIAVAIDGDLVVVAASGAEHAGIDSGVVYVFRRDGANWIEEAKLVPSDAAAFDRFGSSTSINGDYVLAGAPGHDSAGDFAGAAYIFWFDGAGWVQQAKLTASNASSGNGFGASVSLAGDIAVVAPFWSVDKSAYVFRRDGTSWEEETMLTPSGLELDDLPSAVSLSGDAVVVGYVQVTPPPGMRGARVVGQPGNAADARAGSAYVFRDGGTGWIEEAKLTPSEAIPHALFGSSVSIDGNVIVVGASEDLPAGPFSPFGSAFVFERLGSGWVERVKLPTGDGDRSESFGKSVAVAGNSILVGAPGDNDACPEIPLCRSGAAYVYVANTCGVSVPTVSQWGVIVMMLSVLTVGGILIARRAHAAVVL